MTNTLSTFFQQKPPPVPPPTPARLSALYASTSAQKLSNPTGYDANTKWWTSVIEELLRTGWLGGVEGSRLVLRVDDGMLERLENGDGVRPKGMGGVVASTLSGVPSTLYPLAQYLASPTPVHAPGSLAYRFVGRPLWWAIGQLNPFGADDSKVEKEEALWKRVTGKEYVHIPLLERAATAVISHLDKNPILDYSSSLYSLSTFRQEFGAIGIPPTATGDKALPEGEHRLSEADVTVLVKWLSRDRGAVVTDGEVVKILETGEKAADHPISEADKGTLAILQTISKVSDQVDAISVQITQCQKKAKSHLSANQKSLALSQLKSKKNLEDLLDKRLAVLHQLQAVLTNINQAKSDIGVMDAYTTATATLKSVLTHPSLSLEHVEKTTEELAEIMADSQEVDGAIRDGGRIAVGGHEVDTDELEGELESLVQEEKERIAEEKRAEEARVKREEERKRTQALDKVKVPTSLPEYERMKRYEDAQDRERGERDRAELERVEREERRLREKEERRLAVED